MGNKIMKTIDQTKNIYQANFGKHKPRVLFVVGSTAQVEMFAVLIKELSQCEIVATNVDKWLHKLDIERSLQRYFTYKPIDNMSRTGVKLLLNEIRPDIVIVGHDGLPMEKLFINISNSINISTLLVQDGILSPIDRFERRVRNPGLQRKYIFHLPLAFSRFVRRKDFSWREKIEIIRFELFYGLKGEDIDPGYGTCSKIAVFSDKVKELLISEGAEPERLVVTGNPKFDAIFNSKSGNCQEKVCQKLGIPIDKKIILLCTQYFVESGLWSSEQRKQFVMAIASATAKIPDIQLVIKLHPPYENEDDYHEIVKNLSPKPVICKYANLPELINACSVAITVSSTTALEAMVARKPVIIIDLFNNETSFYKGSGALFVTRQEEILSAIEKAIYDSKTIKEMMVAFNKFVYDMAYLQDGKASKRIADLIKNIAINKNISGCEA